MKRKILIAFTALILVAGLVTGGTLAYLQSTTPTKTNTFTIGNVHLQLDEYGNTDKAPYVDSGKLIPGTEVGKVPVLTVINGSESCYVRAKVEIPAALQALIDKKIIDVDFSSAWVKTGDYYYLGDGSKTAQASYTANANGDIVLPELFTRIKINAKDKDGKNVNSDEFKDLTDASNRQIKITGYAIQSASFANAAAAWSAFDASDTRS